MWHDALSKTSLLGNMYLVYVICASNVSTPLRMAVTSKQFSFMFNPLLLNVRAATFHRTRRKIRKTYPGY